MPDAEQRTRIPFQGSPNPTLGIELELQIIDADTMNLTSASIRILENNPDSTRIKQELTQSTIEVITGICKTVAEARLDLETSLKALYAMGDREGFTFAAAGTHPFAQWRSQSIFPDDRYETLVDRIQWPARRLMIFGLHVHVGISSGEKAVAVQNMLTNFLPHLLAPSASSPFIDFRDTGLASSRTQIFEGMPNTGLPYRMSNYGEFQRFMNSLIRAGTIDSIREIWWDIRPHPSFGTIEVRICDIPSNMTDIAAMAALVQSLVVWLDELYTAGDFVDLLYPWIVRENKWRAARYGLEAEIIIDNRGTKSPLRTELARLIETLAPVARRLSCETELQHVLTILASGASYQRQRTLYENTANFALIIGHLIDELRNGTGNR